MLRKTTSLVVGMALFAVAGMVVAQNADQNTGGPTRNTLQLRLIEPAEGATISGDSVRVTVDYNDKTFGAGPVARQRATGSSSGATRPPPERRAPVPAPSTYQSAPAPPAPMETTLPKTASASPQLALLGLALVAGGLLVGRKGR